MATQLPPLFIDFETYWDGEFSLSKISVPEYIYGRQFEVLGFAYWEEDPLAVSVKPKWFTGTFDECRRVLTDLAVDRRQVIAHNAQFDGAVLEWHYDLHPPSYFCTMFAARPFVVPHTGSASLATCADFLQIQSKGDAVLVVKGRRRSELSPHIMAQLEQYACHDVFISSEVARFARPKLPRDEQQLIDLTVKKFTRPRLVVSTSLLDTAADEIADAEAKASLALAAIGVSRKNVTSNIAFAQELMSRGVDVPKKISPVTGVETFALAKRDAEFTALANHPNPEVRLLVESRLLLKSSIERTRIDKFRTIASATRGLLPVPLTYYGAHTGRFSGSMGVNLQNLPRGSSLRKAVQAPPGFKVVTVDLASIEARITATMAHQWNLVRLFAEGKDVYSEFATTLYGYPVSDCEATKLERFVGKMCILGLGFGMGADKYQATMAGFDVTLTDEEASNTVKVYRTTYPGIPRLWRQMDRAISSMLELGPRSQIELRVGAANPPYLTVKKGYVVLPNGMPIYYPRLTRDGQNRVTYMSRTQAQAQGFPKFLWGGALTENVVQALARIIISRAETRLARAGLVSVLQVHDELVFVVPDHAVPTVTDVLKRTLTDPVPWMPDLPLACKVGVGATYGDAK